MSLMHTTFEDGPAKGARLGLARAPILLRVVIGADGGVDALDQADDAPREDERVYAYVLIAEPGVCFIDGRDAKGRRWGERRATGTYRLLAEQPEEAVMRDTARWRAWCGEVWDLIAPEWARGKAARSAQRSGGKASVEPSGPSPARGHQRVDDGEEDE